MKKIGLVDLSKSLIFMVVFLMVPFVVKGETFTSLKSGATGYLIFSLFLVFQQYFRYKKTFSQKTSQMIVVGNALVVLGLFIAAQCIDESNIFGMNIVYYCSYFSVIGFYIVLDLIIDRKQPHELVS